VDHETIFEQARKFRNGADLGASVESDADINDQLRAGNVPIQPCQHRPSGGSNRGDRGVRVRLLGSAQGRYEKQLRADNRISEDGRRGFAILASAFRES
jgi:hypothetical protein